MINLKKKCGVCQYENTLTVNMDTTWYPQLYSAKFKIPVFMYF